MNHAGTARAVRAAELNWRGLMTAIATTTAMAGLILSVPLAARAQDIESNPSKVVATIGSHKITEGDVDEEIKPQLASMQNQLYQARRDAIDKLADKYALDQAAKK